jgi:hypothetical protein
MKKSDKNPKPSKVVMKKIDKNIYQIRQIPNVTVTEVMHRGARQYRTDRDATIRRIQV